MGVRGWLQVSGEPPLEQRKGFDPARLVLEAMSQQPDELAGELEGKADVFSSRYPFGGGGAGDAGAGAVVYLLFGYAD